MTPWFEKASVAGACLFTMAYLIGAAGVDIPGLRGTEPVPGRATTFHGGKTATPLAPDPGCQSPSCHEPFPHRKDRTEAAFRNMHLEFAECLSCHGKEPESHWTGEPGGKSRKIRYAREGAAKNPHADFGQAATCRKCHSESGRQRLREKGMTGLPPAHADPIALRMLEGGPKRWAPADIR